MCVQSPGTLLPDVKEFLLRVFTHDTANQFELLGAADIVKERRSMNEVYSNTTGLFFVPKTVDLLSNVS